jgi:hypothetical protein
MKVNNDIQRDGGNTAAVIALLSIFVFAGKAQIDNYHILNTFSFILYFIFVFFTFLSWKLGTDVKYLRIYLTIFCVSISISYIFEILLFFFRVT